MKDKNLSSTDFDSFRSVIVNQQNTLFSQLPAELKDTLKNTSEALSKVLADDVKMDVSGILPLGILSNTENNIAFGILRSMEMSTEEGDIILASSVVVQNMVFVEDKILILNGVIDYTSDKDIELVSSLLIKWGNELTNKNSKQKKTKQPD